MAHFRALIKTNKTNKEKKMNISVSLKLRNKETKAISKLKIEKKGVSIATGTAFTAAIKGGLPKKETMVAGKDSAQLIIKTDGKATLNQKFTKVDLKSLENICIAMATK